MGPLPAYIPFGIPLRIGTDICHITRIHRLLRGRYAYHFVRRILKKQEIREMRESGRFGVVEDWRRIRTELNVKENGSGNVQEREGEGVKGCMGASKSTSAATRFGRDEFWSVGGKREGETGDGFRMVEGRMQREGWRESDLGIEARDRKSAGLKDEGTDTGLDVEGQNEAGRVKELQEKSAEELKREMVRADEALWGAARWLAGRFAAKEATMKAYASRRLTYHSILILKPPPKEGVEGSVAPVVLVLNEDAGKARSDEEREEVPVGQEVRVSISHDGDYATAVCLAVDE
ncbi:hypothetical protein VTL71DRAFT_2147 [Oculimacula yallundae]|uniref:4'-phosphopantetheinyl transferase domain-containing protein n=1 Tax=Oculimacula yallundae TaxID=86028 RepID=A0ABR4C9Z3_9HELO